jgi:hypothetical protein
MSRMGRHNTKACLSTFAGALHAVYALTPVYFYVCSMIVYIYIQTYLLDMLCAIRAIIRSVLHVQLVEVTSYLQDPSSSSSVQH